MPLMECRVVVPPSSAREARSASHRTASSSEAPRGTCGHPSVGRISTRIFEEGVRISTWRQESKVSGCLFLLRAIVHAHALSITRLDGIGGSCRWCSAVVACRVVKSSFSKFCWEGATPSFVRLVTWAKEVGRIRTCPASEDSTRNLFTLIADFTS